MAQNHLFVVIFFQKLKERHSLSSAVAVTVMLWLASVPIAMGSSGYRIGYAVRPQYTFAHLSTEDVHTFGTAVKGFLTNVDQWELGVGISGGIGPDHQLHTLFADYTFFIGKYWDDPRWLFRPHAAFGLLISDVANVDRGGFLIGATVAYRFPKGLWEGHLDPGLGVYYSTFGSLQKGFAIELSVQWSFSINRQG